VLIGQPELKNLLAQDRLRQLRQRILVHSELRPLTQHGHRALFQHRLTLAGASVVPFHAAALRSIHRFSKGVPRVINNLCDKALLSSFVRDSDEVNFWTCAARSRRFRLT